MLARSHSPRYVNAARGVAALVAVLALATTQKADVSWEPPVPIAPASQPLDGGSSAVASIGVNDSNIAIGYLTSNQAIFASLRDSGAPAYTSPMPVASTSGSNTLVSPAVVVSAQGQTLAAWGLGATDTANSPTTTRWVPTLSTSAAV